MNIIEIRGLLECFLTAPNLEDRVAIIDKIQKFVWNNPVTDTNGVEDEKIDDLANEIAYDLEFYDRERPDWNFTPLASTKEMVVDYISKIDALTCSG